MLLDRKLENMKQIITIIFILISLISFSCECEYSRFDNEVANSTYIFSGLVISKENITNRIKDKSFYPPIKYRVVIINTWKGNLKDTIDLYSGAGGGDCGFEFSMNNNYLIWAKIDSYGLTYTNRCRRTRLLDESPDIDLLNKVFKYLL